MYNVYANHKNEPGDVKILFPQLYYYILRFLMRYENEFYFWIPKFW